MRKVLVILLVIGFMIGMFSVVAGLCEESSVDQENFLDGNTPEDGIGDPIPCGGGDNNGGGGGQPG